MYIMPVNILFKRLISETPLKLFGSLIDPDLCMGQRILNYPFSGYSPRAKIILIKGRRIEMPLVVLTIIFATIPSGLPN